MTGSHWDKLALGWAACEHGGMTQHSIDPFVNRIKAPVLVVGAGQGMIVEYLSQLGLQTIGIDASEAMITLGRRRRSVNLIHAYAENLPFEEACFSTVIITTGVLNLDSIDQVLKVFAEAKRVSRVGATIVAGFFSPSLQARRIGKQIGYLHNWRQYQARLFEIWHFNHDSVALANLIARWAYVPEAEAKNRADLFSDVLIDIYQSVEKIAGEIKIYCSESFQILKEALNYELQGCSEETAKRLFKGLQIEKCEWHCESCASTATLIGSWPTK